MPKTYRATLLSVTEGSGVAIDKSLAMRYATSQCTKDEKFILDLCDVRVKTKDCLTPISKSKT
jgi:hypothetical protein